MAFRLMFFRDENDPFSSPHPEMPAARFSTEPEARAAAMAFVGGMTEGGHDSEQDIYWAREDLADDMHALTKIVVERT